MSETTTTTTRPQTEKQLQHNLRLLEARIKKFQDQLTAAKAERDQVKQALAEIKKERAAAKVPKGGSTP